MIDGLDRTRPRILIVGIGNPDRGDDGIGAAVARSLISRLPDDVAILLRSGDMLALIDDWAGFDIVICIDAAAPMGAPGRIHRIDAATEGLPPTPAPRSSHGLGVGDAIELARALGRGPSRIVVYAIEGSCFDSGAPLTVEVAAAAPRATERILAEVAALRDAPKAYASET